MKWIVWVLLLLNDNSWLMVLGHLWIQYLWSAAQSLWWTTSSFLVLNYFIFATWDVSPLSFSKQTIFFSIKIIFKKIWDTSCLENSITFFFFPQNRHILYTLRWLVKKPSIHSQWPGSSSHHLLGMTGDDLLESAITDLSCNILWTLRIHDNNMDFVFING